MLTEDSSKLKSYFSISKTKKSRLLDNAQFKNGVIILSGVHNAHCIFLHHSLCYSSYYSIYIVDTYVINQGKYESAQIVMRWVWVTAKNKLTFVMITYKLIKERRKISAWKGIQARWCLLNTHRTKYCLIFFIKNMPFSIECCRQIYIWSREKTYIFYEKKHTPFFF